MSALDWIVMLGTLFGIVGYGVWKTRDTTNVQDYLLGKRELKWWTIGLSIMATQASAITFLSTPGQAYEEGMGFAQFYFGLPIAMVILSVFFLPIYYNLKVYTAYEYLEGRFGKPVRMFTASLFLVSRGLAAGLTIFAPAIILSSILGWNLALTNLFIGLVVIIYTVAGGTTAVSQTQQQQMIVILSGMFIAGVILVFSLPQDVSFVDALSVAGKMEKLEVVDFSFNLNDKYTIWTGILGGTFLFLSYFGTDQSQVQRYLSGRSLTESRLGLLFNGILKVPMQFSVLFVGILVFMFYQFTMPPVHFNKANVDNLEGTSYETTYQELDQQHTVIFENKKEAINTLIGAIHSEDEAAINTSKANINQLVKEESAVREDVKELIQEQNPDAETKDTDYVFISFVMGYMPVGLVGLLLAVIFSAAMSSTASELNALATTTTIDIYKRNFKKDGSDKHYLNASRLFTAGWGVIALFFAMTAQLFDNLIEAVNIIGSLFYGAILGIFLVAFIFKNIKGRAVLWAGLFTEIAVISIFALSKYGYIKLAFLWLNPIGCLLLIGLAFIFQSMIGEE
ncbi:MAG: sodium:solute symporter, partial [Saprospiraceae bacterium]